MQVRGVVAYLVDRPDGSVDLVLDDVVTKDAQAAHWARSVHFTVLGPMTPEEAAAETRLPESKLADIGLAFIARLAAFRKVG